MNILPLIIGFILVFAFLSTTFLKETRVVTITERSADAAFRIDTDLRNTMTLRNYLQKAQVKRKPRLLEKTKKKQSYYSLRAIAPPITPSKLNLSALFDEPVVDVHQHPLYPIAAQLLVTLYNETSLFPEKKGPKNWETKLLDALIAKGKQLSERDTLTDLFPDDPELHTLYYKMLKGTNRYLLGKDKKGIPPLGNFLSLEPEKKERTIHFCFASFPLLHALFGEKIASEIVMKEKTEWEATGKRYFSSKDDLQEYLTHDANIANVLILLEPYLCFDKQLPRKTHIAGQDTITGLVITREIL